ncbi:MAG TPA: hypothetical protein VH540_16085 [Ktedonobacterales bacterium]|jgi:hypothetical protein
MEQTSRIERWAWLGFFLLALALLTPPGVIVGLALWFWIHWKKGMRTRWFIVGGLAVAGWVGLVLLMDMVVNQITDLRADTALFSDLGQLTVRLLPLWFEGLLLAPTFACLIELFHPATTLRSSPPGEARPKQQQLPPGAQPRQKRLPAARPEHASSDAGTEREQQAPASLPAADDFGEPPAQASA